MRKSPEIRVGLTRGNPNGERALVVCTRLEDLHGNEHLILDDSGYGICAGCKAVVVVSPSSIKRFQVFPVCRQCYSGLKKRKSGALTRLRAVASDAGELAEIVDRHKHRN